MYTFKRTANTTIIVSIYRAMRDDWDMTYRKDENNYYFDLNKGDLTFPVLIKPVSEVDVEELNDFVTYVKETVRDMEEDHSDLLGTEELIIASKFYTEGLAK